MMKKPQSINNAIKTAVVKDSIDSQVVISPGRLGREALTFVAEDASAKAFQRAKKTGIPLLYEEKGILYREFNDGKKEVVRIMPQSKGNIPSSFTLE